MSQINQSGLAASGKVEVGLADDQWTAQLIDGKKIDGRTGLAYLELLQVENRQDPELVKKLLTIAEGGSASLSHEEKIDFFRGGSLRPVIEAILLNAASITDGKVQFRNPFMDTDENRQVFDTLQEKKLTHDLQLLEDIRKLEDGNDQGHSF